MDWREGEGIEGIWGKCRGDGVDWRKSKGMRMEGMYGQSRGILKAGGIEESINGWGGIDDR